MNSKVLKNKQGFAAYPSVEMMVEKVNSKGETKLGWIRELIFGDYIKVITEGGKPVENIAKSCHLSLFFASFIFVCGCDIAEDFYIDDHEIAGPEALTVTKVYPGVARFTVSQEIATSTNLPPDSFKSAVMVERVAQDGGTPLAFLVRLYSDSLQQSESLVVARRWSVESLSDIFALGTVYQTVLDPRNVELIVLDAGMAPEDQVPERGYFTGTYIATKDAEQVAVGMVNGYIEFNGYFRFEFNGTAGLRFLSGNGIHDGTGFRVNANLTAADRTVVAPLQDLIPYSTDTLTGDFDMAAADFDHIQFILTKKP